MITFLCVLIQIFMFLFRTSRDLLQYDGSMKLLVYNFTHCVCIYIGYVMRRSQNCWFCIAINIYITLPSICQSKHVLSNLCAINNSCWALRQQKRRPHQDGFNEPCNVLQRIYQDLFDVIWRLTFMYSWDELLDSASTQYSNVRS